MISRFALIVIITTFAPSLMASQPDTRYTVSLDAEAASSPVKQYENRSDEAPKTPVQISFASDSMDSDQLQQYKMSETPAELDPLAGNDLSKLIKKKKYALIAQLVSDCLENGSERARKSLRKKLKNASMKFHVNHATIIICTPLEYLALTYENPKAEERNLDTAFLRSFQQLVRASIVLLERLPVNLDEYCKNKEMLREILISNKQEVNRQAAQCQEMVEKPSYTESPQEKTADISALEGESSFLDMSSSFQTPASGSWRPNLQRSLFLDDDAEESVSTIERSMVQRRSGEKKLSPGALIFEDDQKGSTPQALGGEGQADQAGKVSDGLMGDESHVLLEKKDQKNLKSESLTEQSESFRPPQVSPRDDKGKTLSLGIATSIKAIRSALGQVDSKILAVGGALAGGALLLWGFKYWSSSNNSQSADGASGLVG